ncbi:MAG: DUF4153 domain-containing protein, partial [bacterium]
MSWLQWQSLNRLGRASFRTLVRFPFVLLMASGFTGISLYWVTYDFTERAEWLASRGIMTFVLGLTLMLSTTLFGERYCKNRVQQVGLNLVGILGLVLYFETLPGYSLLGVYHHFVLLAAGTHLLVSFAPYVFTREIDGFWQYNKTLFIRILTAVLYTTVIYIGLTICLTTMQYLFLVDISSATYSRLWIIIVGIFNTWFFLAGIPEDWDALQKSDEYPSGLKMFTQYVLVPLITVYFMILILYTLKILVQWQLPKGLVGYLVSGYSVCGLLSILLIFPVQDQRENRWISIFGRMFYYGLLPLLVLLWVAIYIRIDAYGVTVNRYLLTVLSVWLSLITVYYLVTNSRNIKVIPGTLCLLIFTVSFGPWGA